MSTILLATVNLFHVVMVRIAARDTPLVNGARNSRRAGEPSKSRAFELKCALYRFSSALTAYTYLGDFCGRVIWRRSLHPHVS
jgi:hypothetical protein